MRLTRSQGRTSYSVEDVIRSQSVAKGRGGVPLASTYTPGVLAAGLSFYWQHRPSCASHTQFPTSTDMNGMRLVMTGLLSCYEDGGPS